MGKSTYALTLCMASLFLLISQPILAAEVVVFPDPNLDAAVRQAINKPTGDILDTDLVGVGFTSLDASLRNISDLTGLEHCTDLTWLNLYWNQIVDLLPLVGLTNLTALNLSYNQIADLLPLAGLTNLTALNLSYNQIADLAPLEGLTNLTALDLVNIQFVDLTLLAGLTNLTYLALSSNRISDLTPLAGLTALTRLALNNNQINDLTPLAGLTSLTTLGLGTNQIADLTPLAGLTNLTDLQFEQNQIADLTPLAGLTSLTRLVPGWNQIADLTPLADLTSLTYLYLRGNQISDLTPLAGLTSLMTLYVDGNQIADLAPLAGLTSLMTLDLSWNQIVDLTPLTGLTNLTWLALVGNQIANVTPLAGLTMVYWLNLDGNQIVDLAPLASLTNLMDLTLGENQIVDLGPLAGLNSLSGLRLDGNQIADLAPLVANVGLGAGDSVSLSQNPLSANALCEQIPQLQWRGVNVSYDGTCVPQEAQLISAHPSSCVRGSTLAVDVTGAYTHFDETSLISFGAGISIDNVVVGNTTSLTVDVSISWIAPPGPRDVTVTTGSEVAFGPSLFTVLSAEGEGEGEGEGGCDLFETLETEGSTVALARGDVLGPLLGLRPENWTNYSRWDIEGVEAGPPGPFGDGILDLWQLAMFADSYCNPNRWLHDEAVAAHEANLLAVMAEWPEGANLHEWIAASVSLSSRMRATVCALFGLNLDNYVVVTLPGKGMNEPFSAEGDCDGDGTSNIEEYEYVVACGGDIEAFVTAASENSPFWEENPALPVAGIIGLLLLCVGIVVVTARLRLKSER